MFTTSRRSNRRRDSRFAPAVDGLDSRIAPVAMMVPPPDMGFTMPGDSPPLNIDYVELREILDRFDVDCGAKAIDL